MFRGIKVTRKWLLIGVTIAVSKVAVAGDAPAATPFRPTLSNPAELSAPGWFEVEAGWVRTHRGQTRREAVPYTAKLAFNEDWGVLLGGEAQVREGDPDAVRSGFGDTSFTLKRRFATNNENLNFGVEAGTKYPSARVPLGTGKTDWTLNGIASLDFAQSWRVDANLGFTRLGMVEEGRHKTSALWAVALSTSLGKWGLAAERSGVHQNGVDNGRQWLAAASYAITPRFVIDFGMSRNRQGGETERAAFLGFTWLTEKIF